MTSDSKNEGEPVQEAASRPLVSGVLLTYCQERYVAESVRSALSQDYDNFELVISDDCSNDATWNIVLEEVERAKRRPDFRMKVLLNRNERNLGIVAHFEKAVSLSTGEIVVGMAGDDISCPNRIRRIVEAWTHHGQNVMALMHGVKQIDVEGRPIDGPLPWTPSFDHPLGAATVYSRRLFSLFPRSHWRGASEDNVYCQRAQLAGDVVTIPDELLYYRIGSGVTSFEDSEKHDRSVCQSEFYAILQTWDDIRFARKRYPQAKRRIDSVREVAVQKSIWCAETWLRLDVALPIRVRVRMVRLLALALKRDWKNWAIRRSLVAALLPRRARRGWIRRFGKVWSWRQLLRACVVAPEGR